MMFPTSSVKMANLCNKKNIIKIFIRYYCKSKPPEILPAIQEVTKKTDLSGECVKICTEKSEECAKFEERVIKQILVEKEQDAHLQSSVSKECNRYFIASQKTTLASNKCGVIRLENITLQKDYPEWVSYNIDQIQSAVGSDQNLKDKKPAVPVQGKTEIPSTLGSKAEGTDRGGKAGGGGAIVGTSNRPVRGEPGKVLLTFIPEEWWRAFLPKTGVTGFGTFLFTFGIFLVSKEYYVLEHNYYTGLSMLFLWGFVIKKLGPTTAKYLDKELDKYEKSWNEEREQYKQDLDEMISNELKAQFEMAGQIMIAEVKRENVLLQLEEEFRKRQMYVYKEVKNRLDYHVAAALVRQRILHKNLVEYVTREVVKSITPEMQNKLIYYSIDNIVADLGKDDKKK